MNIPVSVWTAIGGGIVGGLVNEARQLIQSRRESKRTLNRLLFAQLDIWAALRKSDPVALVDIISRVVAERSGIPEAELRELYGSDPTFRAMLAKVLPESISPVLEERYRRAIDELSETNAVLAYELSGRTELAKYVNAFRDLLEAWRRANPLPPADLQLALDIEPRLLKTIRDDALASFEKDLVVVARAVGWRCRRTIAKKVARAKTPSAPELEAEFRSILDKALTGTPLGAAP